MARLGKVGPWRAPSSARRLLRAASPRTASPRTASPRTASPRAPGWRNGRTFTGWAPSRCWRRSKVRGCPAGRCVIRSTPSRIGSMSWSLRTAAGSSPSSTGPGAGPASRSPKNTNSWPKPARRSCRSARCAPFRTARRCGRPTASFMPSGTAAAAAPLMRSIPLWPCVSACSSGGCTTWRRSGPSGTAVQARRHHLCHH